MVFNMSAIEKFTTVTTSHYCNVNVNLMAKICKKRVAVLLTDFKMETAKDIFSLCPQPILLSLGQKV